MRINELPVTTFNRLKMNFTELDYEPNEYRTIQISNSTVIDFTDTEDVRVVIKPEEENDITVIMNYSASETLNIETEVELKESSSLKLIQIDAAQKGSRLINQICGNVAKGASIEIIQLFPGRGDVYTGANIDLNGNESAMVVKTAYLAKAGQKVDMNYVANQWGKGTTSEIIADGVLKDGASKIFRATIDFKTGSSGSVGKEEEKALLLGDDLVNQSIPLILCSEEDVAGSHGAQIGSLDEDTLLYFAARGIDEAFAQRIITLANFNKYLKFIEDSSIREKTEQLIEEI